jgi:ABC-2 type transport system permease protein
MVITNLAKDAYKLLKKDLILLKRRLMIILLLVLPFIILDSFYPYDQFFFYAISTIFTFLLCTIMSIEGKAKNQNLMPSLPLTRKNIVLSRFLRLFIFYLTSLLLYFFLTVIIHLSRLPMYLGLLGFSNVIASFLLFSFLTSITLLSHFASRIDVNVLSVLIFSQIYLVWYLTYSVWLMSHPEIVSNKIYTYFTLVSFLLLLVSYSLSLLVYKRREFI